MSNKNSEDEKPGAVQPTTSEPVQQVMIAMCQFPCLVCGQQIGARIPPYRVFNFPEASGVVIGHERFQKCPKCSAQYVALIGGVKDAKIELVWKQVQTNETAIAAPTGKTNAGVMKQ